MSQTLARCNRIARRSIEHCHPYPQLLLGWRGVLDIEFSPGGEHLELGLAAILPPSERHLFRGGDDSCEILVIDLDTDDPCLTALEQSCTLQLRESLFATPKTLSLPPSLIPMVELATRQLKADKSTAQSALLNHQLAILFVSQLSELLVLGHTDTRGLGRLSATLLDSLIDERLTSPPDNHLLADACHLSQSQLHLRCLRDFGVTPQQYVMNRRLRWARFWLRETQRTVSEIAFDLGFSGVSSFSRAYRCRMGCSPSEERKVERRGAQAGVDTLSGHNH
ncbi:helix-turn-helix transcriptional regulator [Halomonas heilongjiangensis]|uniref:AraC family transcriptional regulator n=1 Tax=Halomonas heilongjiangensis TaxID=1387883 RepID=A0A2N7TVI6_9GAMM|nr:AraC family transcriptional regulator [Halomonas heilongjiangensis]PMR72203.1 AraC family transcriptional regulator [Halomonas heilongjiangensis]PXX91454.1 AraC family transcriptional regulator [Halomonas heilongjiangensis]